MQYSRKIAYFLTHITVSSFHRAPPALSAFAFVPPSVTVSHSLAQKPFSFTSSSLTTLSASPSADKMSTRIDSSTSLSAPISVRVVSYNLLSSHLAEPDYHTKCQPEDLLASNRLARILNKLEHEIETAQEPVVFCLQEVSHDWAKALHVFFAGRNYHLVTALYGRKFNGYMGIATAFPLEDFELKEVDLVKLSDTRRDGWPRPPPDDSSIVKKYIKSALVNNPITAAYTYIRGSPKKTDDAWDYSKYRQNQFIAVQIEQKNRGTNSEHSFWVGNYHMPCAFRTPAVMNLHADLVADRIQYLASTNNAPYVLAGDFNILPESPHYTLLTTGKIDTEDETYPPSKYGTTWQPRLSGMASAYNMYNQCEPEFTNAAHNGALNADDFVGTLDYIFLSSGWKVTGVKSLPAIEDLNGGVYPNVNEPSDHLMIAASLEL